MQSFQTPVAQPQSFAALAYLVATEPVGGVNDSIPVHPDERHPDFDDFKQKNKRKPSSDLPSEQSDRRRPDADHQIDEYA